MSILSKLIDVLSPAKTGVVATDEVIDQSIFDVPPASGGPSHLELRRMPPTSPLKKQQSTKSASFDAPDDATRVYPVSELEGAGSDAKVVADSVDSNEAELTIEEEADAAMTVAGHLTLMVLFYGALVAYVAMIIISWLGLPPTVANLVRPSETYPPVALDVTPRCVSGQCGNITIRVNNSFADVPQLCRDAYVAAGTPLSYVATNVDSGSTHRVLLCRVPDAPLSTNLETTLFTYGVTITFENMTSAGLGEIVVRASDETALRSPRVSSSSFSGTPMQKLLSVGNNMIKTFNIGLFVQTTDGTADKLAPYALQYQMEGSRPRLATATDVVLRLSPFANVKELTNDRSVLTMLADIGGAAELVVLVFVVIIPLWTLLFAAQGKLPRVQSAA